MPYRDWVSYRALARSGLIAASASAAIVFFVWAENHYGQHFQACIREATSHQSANNRHKPRFTLGRWIGPQFGCSLDFIDRHNGIVAALAGIAVAAFTLTLKWSTDRLWKAGREELETTQRAFVFTKEIVVRVQTITRPAGIGITGQPFPETYELQTIYFAPVWENGGTTPAYRARAGFNLQEMPEEIGDDFTFHDIEGTKPVSFFVGPRATAQMLGGFIRKDVVDRIAARKSHLYVWGWVDYDDGFRDTPRHRTEFCFEIGLTGSVGEVNFVSTAICSRFNGADDQCVRKPEPYPE